MSAAYVVDVRLRVHNSRNILKLECWNLLLQSIRAQYIIYYNIVYSALAAARVFARVRVFPN